MSKIVRLDEIRELRRKTLSQEQLDIAASYTCLEQCLKYIDMNNLEVLKDLKDTMRKTMKKLSDRKHEY